MTVVENWPGRGFYRGNKQAAMVDAMRVGDIVAIRAQPSLLMQKATETAAINVGKFELPFVAPTDPGDPKSRGYTGNSCQNQDCGSMRMVVSGHCEVCLDCGSSSGCS
jgi:ribonucleoside-diphosphate reductase alpha chain